jgi:hypothetical protein
LGVPPQDRPVSAHRRNVVATPPHTAIRQHGSRGPKQRHGEASLIDAAQ